MKGSVKFPPGADDKCSKEGQNLVNSVGVDVLSRRVHLVTLHFDFSSSIVTPRQG